MIIVRLSRELVVSIEDSTCERICVCMEEGKNEERLIKSICSQNSTW